MNKNYLRWSETPYPEETALPIGVDPRTALWPLHFFCSISEWGMVSRTHEEYAYAIAHPDSIDWEVELTKVKLALAANTDQTILESQYWGAGAVTKQWTPIIDRLIDTYQLSPSRAARVIAMTNLAATDSFIICWFLKYLWDVARPCQNDVTLQTTLKTPKHPSYPAGHAIVPATIIVVLSYFFPSESEKLSRLCDECAISRHNAGVHFPADDLEGMRLGKQIGEIIVAQLANEYDACGKKVDVIPTTFLDAILMPPPYEQVIPFP